MRQREKPNPSDQISRQKEFEFAPPLRWPLTHSSSPKWRLKNKVSAVRPLWWACPLDAAPLTAITAITAMETERYAVFSEKDLNPKSTLCSNCVNHCTSWSTDSHVKSVDSIITSWNILKCKCTSQPPESETAPGRAFILSSGSLPVDVCRCVAVHNVQLLFIENVNWQLELSNLKTIHFTVRFWLLFITVDLHEWQTHP